MNEPLISVIIPVYNVEKFLKKCLNSVISQDYKNLEIILIDDCSSDDSGKICDEYSKTDSRIKVIHKTENEGVSSARNTGLENISGQYFSFVDSDDWIEPDMISYLYNGIIENDADISVCGHSAENTWKNKSDHVQYKLVFNKKEAFNQLIHDVYLKSYLWNKLYKVKTKKNVMFPKNKTYEDLGEAYKFIINADKIVILPKMKYHYNNNKFSIVNNDSIPNALCAMELIEKRYFATKNEYPNIEKHHHNIFQRFFIRYLFLRYVKKNSITGYENDVESIVNDFVKNNYNNLIKPNCFFLDKYNYENIVKNDGSHNDVMIILCMGLQWLRMAKKQLDLKLKIV